MRRLIFEECTECTDEMARTPGQRCRNHRECAARPDARTAADIGVGWAIFVRSMADYRRPWPPFGGRCAAIARRLVAWLAPANELRRDELARICWWRAGIRWEWIAVRDRDRPAEPPARQELIYPLPGYDGLCIRFRPRRNPYARMELARRW
jgi:hypothetical protein